MQIIDGRKIVIDQNIQKCSKCGRPVKGRKEIKAENLTVVLPVWDCQCSEIMQREHIQDHADNRMKRLLGQSNIDAEFLENDFPVYRLEIAPYYDDLEWIKAGRQLLVFGDPGNHKTGHVTAIAKRAMENAFSVVYFRATEVPYQKNYKLMDEVDLLIIDNFGKDAFENSRGSLFDILDKRIHNYRSTILILNSNPEEVSKIYHAPMMSRLNGFIRIPMDGPDKRKKLTYGRTENVREENRQQKLA